jgi:hypothetical protein
MVESDSSMHGTRESSLQATTRSEVPLTAVTHGIKCVQRQACARNHANVLHITLHSFYGQACARNHAS